MADSFLRSLVRQLTGGIAVAITPWGFQSSNPTAGMGYGTGAGGTVVQGVSKSTAVTLNKVTGSITMNAAQLNTVTSVSFTLTNSAIGANDGVSVSIASGATAGSYFVTVDAVAVGSCLITLRNYSGGNLSEAVVLNFNVEKGAVS